MKCFSCLCFGSPAFVSVPSASAPTYPLFPEAQTAFEEHGLQTVGAASLCVPPDVGIPRMDLEQAQASLGRPAVLLARHFLVQLKADKISVLVCSTPAQTEHQRASRCVQRHACSWSPLQQSPWVRGFGPHCSAGPSLPSRLLRAAALPQLAVALGVCCSFVSSPSAAVLSCTTSCLASLLSPRILHCASSVS